MSDAFLSLPAAERRDILETAADRLGRPAAILEKDGRVDGGLAAPRPPQIRTCPH